MLVWATGITYNAFRLYNALIEDFERSTDLKTYSG